MKRHDSPSKEVSQEGGGIIGLGGNLGGKTRPQVDEKSHENGPTQHPSPPDKTTFMGDLNVW